MSNLFVLTASSANQLHSADTEAFVIVAAIVIIAVAITLFFKKSNGKGNQIEDEKFYLREIRKYVRIIAVIMLISVVFSIVTWILAIL